MTYNEYMMESVCSALDELLGGGTLTEEQADQVYDLAYDKYIEESRALDRYIDDKGMKIAVLLQKIKNDPTLTEEERKELKTKLKAKNERIVGNTSLKELTSSMTGMALRRATNKSDYKHHVDKPGKEWIKYNGKKLDMNPAEEKKPGKYLDMYKDKHKADKYRDAIDEI